MFDLGQFEQFHFIRPEWLLVIIPAILLLIMVYLRDNLSRRWRGVISPHLLESLTKEGGEGQGEAGLLRTCFL